MGDRANVMVHSGDDPAVYLYTHWGGDTLPAVLASALVRGRSQWSDDQYLARIIFSGMVPDRSGTTGYGISAYVGDGADRILDVDTKHQTVTPSEGWGLGHGTVPFDEFITRHLSYAASTL